MNQELENTKRDGDRRDHEVRAYKAVALMSGMQGPAEDDLVQDVLSDHGPATGAGRAQRSEGRDQDKGQADVEDQCTDVGRDEVTQPPVHLQDVGVETE